MSNLFLLTFLLSPIALLVGLIKPKLFLRFLTNRKKIALAFGGLTVLSFFLFGATLPSSEKKNNVIVESEQVKGVQTEVTPSPTITSTPTATPTIKPVQQTSNPTTQPASNPVVKATVKPTSTIFTQTTSCKYSCSGPDKDCSDFSTHAEAQTFFNCCGFSATYDPMKLDSARGTGNGIACESLP